MKFNEKRFRDIFPFYSYYSEDSIRLNFLYLTQFTLNRFRIRFAHDNTTTFVVTSKYEQFEEMRFENNRLLSKIKCKFEKNRLLSKIEHNYDKMQCLL